MKKLIYQDDFIKILEIGPEDLHKYYNRYELYTHEGDGFGNFYWDEKETNNIPYALFMAFHALGEK